MAKEVDGQQWAKELVKRIGKEVKAARGSKSAVWLSDRTAELGYRISPTVIAKLDSGHRGEVLSVAEWLILSAALGITPMALLFPDIPDGPVEMLPGVEGTAFSAAMWVAGDEIEGFLALPDGAPRSDYDYRQIMLWSRARAHYQRKLRELKNILGTLDSDDEIDNVTNSMVRARQGVQHLNETLQSSGAVVDSDA
ncbi:hypothetical protein [Mycobacterium sp. DL592]|uniref:hypothetical protein n=1 Tax=Mycobacterium sp. DL592 TaxID=2675524 RepID=UPI00141DB3C4|nr:hypothetical protein [Mycobacterium sp. DL592]